MTTARLDKIVASCSGLGRSAARRAVARGRVRVNGRIERDPGLHVDPSTATVALDGETLHYQAHVYLMLHKPAEVVCSADEPGHTGVLDLLDLPLQQRKPFTVGRLDADATGLVLLTDDGAWAHRVTSPRHKVDKVYLVSTVDALGEHLVEEFSAGLPLRGDDRPTAPATLEIVAPCLARVTLCEGRYHQVKRMFAAVGNRVTSLHRERIGPIRLDSRLAPGQWRSLEPGEIAAFGAPAAVDG